VTTTNPAPTVDGATPAPVSAPFSATLRFFAAARTAVGRDDQRVEVPAGERPTIGRLLTEVRPVEGVSAADFRDVLLRCSFLVDGLTTRDREQLVPDGAVIDVMPPFAGG
jgi:molybdopterin converting factor small subunit